MKKNEPHKRSLNDIARDTHGQTLIEYGLLLILIAIVVIGAVQLVGKKTESMYSTIESSIP